jgi:hypothetical protein
LTKPPDHAQQAYLDCLAWFTLEKHRLFLPPLMRVPMKRRPPLASLRETKPVIAARW